MGSGKKNKRGGAPKAKGRLASALSTVQQAAATKARQLQAEANKEELLNNKKNQEVNKQAKKKRRVERMREELAEEKRRGKEREIEERQKLKEENGDGSSSDEEEEVREVVVKTVAAPRKRKGTVPYKLGERILLVGEGNFSFAHALVAAQPPIISPQLLFATAFDTQEAAHAKYPDLKEHVRAIRKAGGTVLFGIDATKLHTYKELKEHKGAWDRVVFNFPHVGQGITDQARNVRANQTLILGFLRSVAPLLRFGTSSIASLGAKKVQSGKKGKRARDEDSDVEDEALPMDDTDNLDSLELGQDPAELENPSLRPLPPPPTTSGTVLITLRTISPYSLWSVQHLGTRGSLLALSILPKPLPKTPQPDYLLVRSFEFDPNDWQGYEHRRTLGFKEGVSSEKNDDLKLSARERGEKRRLEKEQQERKEKEERDAKTEIRNGGKALMRTWEFELKDFDGLYD